jgi:hypothetical protein
MTPHEQIVKGLRDAANVPHSVELSLDDPQAWPAILTYADTIEADDPDEAEELRRLVVCYQNGVEFPDFTAEQDAQKLVDDVLDVLRSKDPVPPAS